MSDLSLDISDLDENLHGNSDMEICNFSYNLINSKSFSIR